MRKSLVYLSFFPALLLHKVSRISTSTLTESTYRSRSSKSALHGLIHWLAGAYAKTGVTINGIAPALIAETKMLPGQNEEMAKSK